MLSVIIPTCNRNHLLRKCLHLLSPANQTIEKAAYEVIVTDDSNENVAKLLIEEYPWVRYVEGPKKGPAANRNNGAKCATGNWLVFLDDDCLPDRTLLSEYQSAIIHNNAVKVFEGCIKPSGEQKSLIEEAPLNETGGHLWSCNFMIHCHVFFQILNGFDENFRYAAMEDVDLHYRLQKLSIQVLFLPNAFVIHPWRLQKKLIAITLKRFHSTLYFLKKHPEKKKDINSYYFIRLCLNQLVKKTLRKAVSLRFKGFRIKLYHDLLQLYFAAYLFIKKH